MRDNSFGPFGLAPVAIGLSSPLGSYLASIEQRQEEMPDGSLDPQAHGL
jgi:hypothetical protein